MSSTEACAIYDALREVRPPLQRSVPTALVDHYVGGTTAVSLLEGRGRATLALHNTVEADFAAGKITCSPGVLQYPDGYTAVGPLTAEGVPTGPDCIIRWPSGDVYHGALDNGVRHGQGRQTAADGKAVYEGSWHRGQRHGQGTQHYADGSRYEGSWSKDERDGQGTLWYTSGDCYEGSWSRGERVGEGCMGWRHGTSQYVEIYQGSWFAGKPHGMGSSTYVRPLTTAAATEDATGAQAQNTVPSQYAAPDTAIVNRYVGEFVCGERHGRGTFFYADGSSYEGNWEHGERAGKGLITTAVGSVVSVGTPTPQSTNGFTEAMGEGLDTTLADGEGGRKKRNAQLVPEVSVADLRGLNDGTEAQFTTAITALLLRYNTSLKALFTRYATADEDVALLFTPSDWWRQRIPGHLHVAQFIRLLSDSGVLGDTVRPSAFIRCVAAAMDNSAAAVRDRLGGELTETVAHATRASKDLLYRLDGSVHYRIFAECLVRLAPLVCVGPQFRGLGDQVVVLVEAYLRGPLTNVPLFPVTRRHMSELRVRAGSLADLFDRAVQLQLAQPHPFLPATVVLNAVLPVLRRSGVTPMAAVASVLTSSRCAAAPRTLTPPGRGEARGDMSESLHTAAMGDGGAHFFSTAVADREMTVLEFVEALASVAELVLSANANAVSVDTPATFDTVLSAVVLPAVVSYLDNL